jgi:copper resistance protein C
VQSSSFTEKAFPMRSRYIQTTLLSIFLVAPLQVVFAHAILLRSTPANASVVDSRNVELTLDYNSRIDARRCTVTLTSPAGKSLPVRMGSSTNPSELKGTASNLESGTYHVHWQVLAADGHITRGEIAFTIAGTSPRDSRRP